MSDEFRNNTGHITAWFAAVMGTISFEMWLAAAGFLVSAFIAWTNHRSRKLQDRLLLEEARRSVELHDLEIARIRAGGFGQPANPQTRVKDFIKARPKK